LLFSFFFSFSPGVAAAALGAFFGCKKVAEKWSNMAEYVQQNPQNGGIWPNMYLLNIPAGCIRKTPETLYFRAFGALFISNGCRMVAKGCTFR